MKSLRSQNYYEILGISRYASPDEIRNAYELSKLTFTQNSLATYSLFSEEENEEILALISKAYETLLNPESRREYDTFLDAGGQGSHHAWESRRPAAAAPARPLGAMAPRAVPAPVQAPGASAPNPARVVPAGTARRELSSRPVASAESPARPPQGREVPHRDAQSRDAAPREPAPKAAPPAPPPHAVKPIPEPAPETSARPAAPPATAAQARQAEVERFLGTAKNYNGETLRKVREMRGLSVFELCSQTKIRQTYVDYIESENFAGLPAPVYIRGFVKLIATALALPPEEVAADYMSRYIKDKGA